MKKIIFLIIVIFTGIFNNVCSQTNNYQDEHWVEKSISKIEWKNSETNTYDELKLMSPLSLYINKDNTSVKVSNQTLIEMMLGKYQGMYYDEAVFTNGVSVQVESRETTAFRGEYKAKNTSGTNQNSFNGALLFYYSKGVSGALEIRCQGRNGSYKYIRIFFNDQKPISILNGSSLKNSNIESKNKIYNYIDRSRLVNFQTNKYEERIDGVNKLNIDKKVDFIIDLKNKYIKSKVQNQKESFLDIISVSNDVFEDQTKILTLNVRNKNTGDEYKVQLREDPGKSFYYIIYATTKGVYDYLTFYIELSK